jgi:hypothetical protein
MFLAEDCARQRTLTRLAQWLSARSAKRHSRDFWMVGAIHCHSLFPSFPDDSFFVFTSSFVRRW